MSHIMQSRKEQVPSDSQEQGQRYMMGATVKKAKTQRNYYPTLFKNNLYISKKIKCKDGFYFPFDPYQMQLDYMRHIKKCLDEGKNCVLESPTGSGKTQCLLSAVFGCVQEYYNNKRRQQRQTREFIKQYPIKIILTSRSHSQLEQIKQQIEKTCYRPSMVVMGSRKQLCAYQSIRALPNISQIYSKCQRAVQRSKALQHYKQIQEAQSFAGSKQKQQNLTAQEKLALQQQSCKFYSGWKDRNKIGLRVLNHFKDKQEPIDINDQYKRCKQVENTCPYYYPTVGKYYADLVVMPYNYILDERLMRRNAGILRNNIIIFDEGHNILDFARDGKTVKLRVNQLEQLISMLRKYRDGKGLSKNDIDIQMFDGGQYSQEDFQIVSEEENQGLPLNTRKIKKYRKIILQMPKQRNFRTKNQIKQLAKRTLQKVYEYRNNFKKYEQQNKLSFQEEQKSKLIDQSTDLQIRTTQIIEQMGQMLKGNQFHINNIRNSYEDQKVIQFILEIKQLGNNFQLLFEKIKQLDLNYYPYIFSSSGDFFVNLSNIIGNEQNIFDYSLFIDLISKKKQAMKLQMRLQCFNPKIIFSQLMKLNPKGVIITSGTLAPIQAWKKETGIQNLEPFSNNHNHVIQPYQCQTVFIPWYDGKSQWYTWSNLKKSCKKAMEAIQLICRETPGGVLVVLPSKSWLNQIRQIFANYGIRKAPWYEDELTKKEVDLEEFKKQYKEICQNPGGLMFAVCRGKLSEGINFQGDMCRAVVIVGVPIPSIVSPDTKAKKNYAQRLIKKYPQQYSAGYVKQWEDQEVIRAVNQGIGRVIRNKKDYGMIFLLDGRYLTETRYKNSISKWAMKGEKVITFNKIESTCKEFFDNIKQKMLK